jgi:hypothetical protein
VVNSTVQAKGANVTFVTPFSKKSITLMPGTDIIADPPVAESAALIDFAAVDARAMRSDKAGEIVPLLSSKPVDAGTVFGGPVPFPSVVNNTPSLDRISLLATRSAIFEDAGSEGDQIRSQNSHNGILSDRVGNERFRTARFGSNSTGFETSSAPSRDEERYLTSEINAFVWTDEALDDAGLTILSSSDKERVTAGGAETASLKTGQVLFAAAKDTTVETPFATVEISAGSVALVLANKNSLGVYDLHDSKKGSVRILHNNGELHLSPGRCAVITNDKSRSLHDTNPIEAIGYRNLHERSLKDNLKMYDAEFAPSHALNAVRPLKTLMASRNPKAKVLKGKLMKTTAVLWHMNAGQEYQLYLKPRTTALLP